MTFSPWQMPNPVFVIGPTGTGKSDLGVTLAQTLDGEIVNIDAMQQYRGMDIGTAKLSVEDRHGVAHHQIDTLDIRERATVANYQDSAVATVEDIMHRGRVPIIVGGSMMYIQSLVDTWTFPETDPTVRARWEETLESVGTIALHDILKERDPDAADSIIPTDGRRIVRALEVGELTGRPFAASRPPIGAPPRWGATLLGLYADVEWLDPRLAQRTEHMFLQGFVDEVADLVDLGLREGITASRAIGYAQVLSHLDGHSSLDEARQDTFVSTRRYVRRQRSWFRRDPRIQWLDPSHPDLHGRALKLLGGPILPKENEVISR